MKTTFNEVRNKWFIQLEDKDSKERISICDYGLVYGTERNQKLGILKQEVVDKIKQILDGNLDEFGNDFNDKTITNRVNFNHLFKTEVYVPKSKIPLILRIRDDSRKQRKIKVVGWNGTQTFIKLLKDENNWKKKWF